MFIRTPYNYDRDLASLESGLACEDESLTQQHDKEDVDLNILLKKFGVHAKPTFTNKLPLQGDFTQITDYRSAMQIIKESEVAFGELPSNIRDRFDHDPAKLLEFIYNKDNREEAIKLGLIDAPKKTADEPKGSPQGEKAE